MRAEDLAEAEPADIAGLLTTAPVAVDELIRQSGESAAGAAGAARDWKSPGGWSAMPRGRVSLA